MSEKEQPPIMDQKLCVNGCGFFGSSNTSHMCSKCWKDTMSQSMREAEGKKDGAVNATALPPLAKAMDEDPQTRPDENASSSSLGATTSSTTPPATPAVVTAVAPVTATATAALVGASSSSSPRVASSSQPPVAASAVGGVAVRSTSSAPAVASFSAGGPMIGGGASVEGAAGAAVAAAVVAEAAAEETPARPEQKNRKRCFTCSKKVGYTGIACRCNYVFCSLHRYPEQHACTFDFKTSDRNDLKRTVVGGGQFSKVDRL